MTLYLTKEKKNPISGIAIMNIEKQTTFYGFYFKFQLQEEINQQTKEYEETKRQIEEDCDTETIDLKTKYERRLKEQIEINEKISSDANNIRKRVCVLKILKLA